MPEATPPAPTLTTPDPKPVPTTLDLDAKVRVDGKDLSVKDLLDQARKAEELTEYRRHADVLMQGSGDAATQEKAVRYLMGQQGFSSDEIDAYVESQHTQEPVVDPTPAPTNPKPNAPAPNPVAEEVAGIQAELKSLKERQRIEALDRMRKSLTDSANKTVDTHPKLAVLLKVAERTGQDQAALKKRFLEDVGRQAADLMRFRSSRGEQFSDSWFEDAASKAAEAIYDRYRAVMGDPDRIGVTPETVTGDMDILRNREPVKPPTALPTSKKSLDLQLADTNNWAVDMLSREAAKMGSGSSKA